MTMRTAAWMVVAAAMAGLLGCSGQKTEPRGATPKSTVAALMRAIDLRDSKELKKCYAQQDEYVQGMAELLDVSKQLQDETEKHLSEGREQRKNLLPNGGPNGEDFRKFESAKEQGDASAVRLTAADGAVMKLVKQNGEWAIEDDGIGGDPAKRQQAGRIMHELAVQVGQVVQDLQNGAYKDKDIKDLRKDLVARQTAVLSKVLAPR